MSLPANVHPGGVHRILRCGGVIRGWFVHPGCNHLFWPRRLRWCRVTGAAFVLAAMTYVAGATAIFAFDRGHKKIAAVQFGDVLLPSRWHRVRTARGDHFHAVAHHLFNQGQFTEAMMLAGRGLELSPAHRDGRLLLARLRLAARSPRFARQTLLDGLSYHATDPEFLKPCLTLLLRQHEDREVVALVRRLLPAVAREGEAAQVLALAGATAALASGDCDAAAGFLCQVPRPARSHEARLLGARIEQQRGHRDLALVQLRHLAETQPDDFEIHREFVHLLLEQGMHDEARRVSLGFQLAHPTQPDARLWLLRACHRSGETSRFAAEVEAYLRDFSSDLRALIALAELGANVGEPALVRRAALLTAQHHAPDDAFRYLAVEALLVAGDYREALRQIREFSDPAQSEGNHRALFDSLQAIAHYGLGDEATGRVFLANFLYQPGLRAENLLAVAARFAALDAVRPAWQVLTQAVAIDPGNHTALSRLVECDVALSRIEELADHLQRLILLRRPSPDLLRVAERKLGSDLFLFSAEAPKAIQAARLALAEAKGKPVP